MDDFNNNNTNNINNQNGELNGFDSVNGNDTAQNGYTVTPDGGFYTKRRDDIIQDEAYGSNYENKIKLRLRSRRIIFTRTANTARKAIITLISRRRLKSPKRAVTAAQR